jgi:uncharacterized damage-inducible protein DinB
VPFAVTAMLALLEEIARVLKRLPADAYAARPSGASGSIGAHVRHSFDHVSALLEAVESGMLTYDHRSRGTSIETDPQAASFRALDLCSSLRELTADDLDRPLSFDVLLDRDGRTMRVATTVARELAFVISHTIHHNATMAVLLKAMDIDVPSRFGYAPATPVRLRIDD